MTRVFISRDAASLSLGAARIARLIGEESLVRDLALEIVATGSRGLFWLEPLVEVETPQGRIAYGPIGPADVPAILAGTAPSLGRIEDHPWLASQTRITFARCGAVDPLEPPPLAGLARAREIGPAA